MCSHKLVSNIFAGNRQKPKKNPASIAEAATEAAPAPKKAGAKKGKR